MADYNSSLPIRTENNGDAAVKIVDGTITSQQLTVNADGSLNITDNAGSLTVDAVNLDIRDLAFATDKVDVSGSEVSLDATTLAALENINAVVTATDLDIRDLNSATDSVTVVATNLDVRDLTHVSDSIKIGDGTDLMAVNADGSINVVITDASPGTAINDYNTYAALAAAASNTHTYTSTGNFYLTQIHATASGKIKIVVAVNGTTRFVAFNSTANPNIPIKLDNPILATTGQTVTIARTNLDNQSMDVYSTICGYNA